jgi:hypothetical protein
MYTDHAGVRRWTSTAEIPDEALRCLCWGHEWSPGPATERPGYGGAVVEVRLSCPCGRLRVDVFDPRSFALLTRHYTGGAGPAPGAAMDRADARAEWTRRTRRRAMRVVG